MRSAPGLSVCGKSNRLALVIADGDISEAVRRAAAKRLLFLSHAVRQMARPERLVSAAEVREIAEHGEVIEDYPEDRIGHSCLMLGYGQDGRAVHVVCSPKPEFLAIVTAYLPDEAEWSDDFKVRIR